MNYKSLFIALLFVCSSSLIGQETSEAISKKWKTEGLFSIILNQSAFNKHWMAGGQSNAAANFSLNYKFNYKNKNWTWDNTLILAYGLTKIEELPYTKTDDRLEWNSTLGKKLNEFWSFSGFLNFKTQVDEGRDNGGVLISDTFSPIYVQLGPGLLYKKSDNFKVNFAPITSRMIYVNKKFTINSSAFGVEMGEQFRYEMGTSLQAYFKFLAAKNITLENTFNAYSNYLDQPGNIDIDYTLNIIMKINRLMSTNLIFQTVYDHNAIQEIQLREVFGLAFNFSF